MTTDYLPADEETGRPLPLPATGLTAPGGKRWPWGPISRIHSIEALSIDIIEYRADKSGYAQRSAWHDHGQTMFSCESRSFYRLDSAIVWAIALTRTDNPNAQASGYFDLMTLGVIPTEG